MFGVEEDLPSDPELARTILRDLNQTTNRITTIPHTISELLNVLATSISSAPPAVSSSQVNWHESARAPTAQEYASKVDTTEFIARELAAHTKLPEDAFLEPVPYLSSSYVQELLLREEGDINPCAHKTNCQAFAIKGVTAAFRVYTTPAEWLNYKLTGKVPKHDAQWCYLCSLQHLNLVQTITAEAQEQVLGFSPPFTFYKDRPGGYKQHAFATTNCRGVVRLLRAYNTADYKVIDSPYRVVEDPSLLYAPPQTPWEPETHEEFIGPRVLSTIVFEDVAVSPDYITHLYIAVPATFSVVRDEANIRLSLAFASFSLGSLRLQYYIKQYGEAILRKAKLLPSAPHAFPSETGDYAVQHSVMLLLFLKQDEIKRMLVDAAGIMRTKLEAMQTDLAPLLAAVTALPMSDKALLTPGANKWCVYAKCFPFPSHPPVIDDEDLGLAKRSNKADKGIAPVLYLFPPLRFFKYIDSCKVPLVHEALQNKDKVCSPYVHKTIEWIAGRGDLPALGQTYGCFFVPSLVDLIGRSDTRILTAVVLRVVVLLHLAIELRLAVPAISHTIPDPALAYSLFCKARERDGKIDAEKDILSSLQPTKVVGDGLEGLGALLLVENAISVHAKYLALMTATHATNDVLAEQRCGLPIVLAPSFGSIQRILAEAEQSETVGELLRLANPSPAVHSKALSDLIQTAKEFDLLAALLLFMRIGAYLHCRKHPSVGARVEFFAAYAKDKTAFWKAASHDHKTQAMREAAIAILIQTHRVGALMLTFDNIAGWVDGVATLGDKIRAGEQNIDFTWPSTDTRIRKTGGSIIDHVRNLMRDVDLRIITDTCIAAGRILPPERFAPPKPVLEAIAKYVSRLPLYREFRPEWLPFALSPGMAMALKMIMRLDSVAETVLEMAFMDPVVYALISAFFRIYIQALKTGVECLDSRTAFRQIGAVITKSEAYIPLYHCASLTSLLCCNRIADISRYLGMPTKMQDHSGTQRICSQLDTGIQRCHPRRQKIASASADSKVTVKTANLAISAHVELMSVSNNEIPVTNHLQKTRKDVGTWAASMYKTVLRLPCSGPVTRVHVIGRILYTSPDRKLGSTCTLCPLCGAKTEFSMFAFGPNGFTCAVCDADVRKPREYSTEVCSFCGSKAEKKLGIWLTELKFVDNRKLVEGKFCSTCYKNWLASVVTWLPKAEVQAVLNLQLDKYTCLDEIVTPPLESKIAESLKGLLASLPANTHDALVCIAKHPCLLTKATLQSSIAQGFQDNSKSESAAVVNQHVAAIIQRAKNTRTKRKAEEDIPDELTQDKSSVQTTYDEIIQMVKRQTTENDSEKSDN